MADFWDRVFAPLRDFRDSLDGFGDTPAQNLASLQGEFDDLIARAAKGDLEAIQLLPEVGGDLVSAIQAQFGNTRRGQVLIDQLTSQIDGVLGETKTDAQIDRDLSNTRNDVLFDIRELLGGAGRPMEEAGTMISEAILAATDVQVGYLASIKDATQRSRESLDKARDEAERARLAAFAAPILAKRVDTLVKVGR